jgi:hypothetical protein
MRTIAPLRLCLASRRQPAHALSCRPTVEDLLLWRDIPKSAAALGVITALYLLLEVGRS